MLVSIGNSRVRRNNNLYSFESNDKSSRLSEDLTTVINQMHHVETTLFNMLSLEYNTN